MLLAHYSTQRPEVGCDEAGRGCLAGSVYAAAVVLPEGYANARLNDSKQLSPARRYRLREEILRDAVAWAVGTVSASEIDEINILNASILAMHRALDGLKARPAFILVDGNRFKPYGSTPFATIVKGDAKYLSIAAASILAKTFRDDEMRRLHEQYPWYGWDHNAGYPTREHRRGIEQHGLTPYHRRSFHLLPDRGPQLPFPED